MHVADLELTIASRFAIDLSATFDVSRLSIFITNDAPPDLWTLIFNFPNLTWIALKPPRDHFACPLFRAPRLAKLAHFTLFSDNIFLVDFVAGRAPNLTTVVSRMPREDCQGLGALYPQIRFEPL